MSTEDLDGNFKFILISRAIVLKVAIPEGKRV